MRVAWPSRLRKRGAPTIAAASTTPEPPAPVPQRLVAVVAVHGMGQQLHFETIQDVVDGMLRAEAAAGHAPGEQVGRIVELDGRRLARAELSLHDRSDRPIGVHVYEGYWAPLTEGQISLWETMKFLLQSAVGGFLRFFDVFHRFLFGRWRNFGRHLGARLLLGALGGFVLSLLALNTALTTIVARLLVLDRPPDEAALHAFTQALALLLAIVLVLTALIGTSHRLRFRLARVPGRWLAQLPALGVLVLAMLATTAIGVFGLLGQLAPFRAPLVSGWQTLVGRLGLSQAAEAVTRFPALAVVVWLMTAWVSLAARYFLLEYVGDVAIYVSDNKVNRFAQVRDQIKTEITAVLRTVYGIEGYDGVIVLGHSLGSVIAYDALNSLITDEVLASSSAASVVGRTRLLLTFGSPLDKTAFLFDTKLRRSATTRALLSSAVQPLITDVAFRQFPWENLSSPSDVISGKLRFYDSDGCRVRELSDPGAVTLLWAHEEYWDAPLLFERIREAL